MGRRAALPLGLALLLVLVSVAALGALAAGETGAPALEIDGVWHSHGDWTVQDGEEIIHLNETIEVAGNLTVEPNATLRLTNVTLLFPPGAASPRNFSVGDGAFLVLNEVNVTMKGAGDRLEALGGTVMAATCMLSFEGQAGKPYSIMVLKGRFGITDSAVVTDATLALSARNSEVGATDSAFVNQSGAPGDVYVAGSGSYTFDTTLLGTLRVADRPAVAFFSTVRFFLFSPAGDPLEGNVSGSGAYGEIFYLHTRPATPDALQLKCLELPGAETNLTPLQRRSPTEVHFTAISDGVGGNTTAVILDGSRVNVTVVLDHPFDIGVASLTIIGGTLETQGLKRAYYLEMNQSQDVHIRVKNYGFATSPATALLVVRKALNGSSWNPVAEKAFDELMVPALQAGESVNLSFQVVPSTYGGFVDASAGCTASVSYLSALSVRIVQPNVTDFRPSNDAAEFNMVAYDVKPRYGPGCERPTADILPFLAAGAGAAVVGVVALSRWSSDGQVAKRAARREAGKRPPL